MTAAAGEPESLNRALVGRARAAADSPAPARAAAAREVLDAVGCMAVGASHPMVRRVAGAARGWRDAGPFPAFAAEGTVSLDHAVVLDSLACHVDEFDSLHPASAVVASAAVIPAALQIAAWRGLGGRELLDAVLAGYAVVTGLGERWGGAGMYGRGWWPTSSFAAVGSAVATGTLLGLDDAALGHAIGIAAAGSGGLLSGDRFGEGHYLSAAEESARGVRAALYAAADARASWNYLDGPADRAFGTAPPIGPETVPGAAAESSVVKLYPCSRPLQGFAAALDRLAAEGVDLREVREVRLALPEPLLRFVSAAREVAGPTEAAASAAFVHAAVRDGRGGDPLFFREATLEGRPPVPSISLVADADALPGSWDCGLLLVDGSGRRHTLRVGAPDAVEDRAVLAKFHGCLAAAGTGSGPAERAAAELLALDGVPDVAALGLHALPRPA